MRPLFRYPESVRGDGNLPPQVLAVELQDAVPHVLGGGGAVAGAVVGEEGVPGVVVHHPLVGLAVFVQLGSQPLRLFRSGILVLNAEEGEQGAGEVGDHVDGVDRAQVGDLLVGDVPALQSPRRHRCCCCGRPSSGYSVRRSRSR